MSVHPLAPNPYCVGMQAPIGESNQEVPPAVTWSLHADTMWCADKYHIVWLQKAAEQPHFESDKPYSKQPQEPMRTYNRRATHTLSGFGGAGQLSLGTRSHGHGVRLPPKARHAIVKLARRCWPGWTRHCLRNVLQLLSVLAIVPGVQEPKALAKA